LLCLGPNMQSILLRYPTDIRHPTLNLLVSHISNVIVEILYSLLADSLCNLLTPLYKFS
jgi:hypothetical protein